MNMSHGHKSEILYRTLVLTGLCINTPRALHVIPLIMVVIVISSILWGFLITKKTPVDARKSKPEIDVN